MVANSFMCFLIAHHRDGLLSSSLLVWSSIAQSVCEWTFIPLAIWCLRLPRFESCIRQKKTTCHLPFDSKIGCLCQSIQINDIYIYIYIVYIYTYIYIFRMSRRGYKYLIFDLRYFHVTDTVLLLQSTLVLPLSTDVAVTLSISKTPQSFRFSSLCRVSPWSIYLLHRNMQRDTWGIFNSQMKCRLWHLDRCSV